MTILDKAQYTLIYKSSCIACITALYGLYRQKYHLAIVPGSIFLTSINYWHHPDYSWRLTLDLVVVRTMIAYQHLMAYTETNAVPYYVCAVLLTLFYGIGQYYFYRGDYWRFTVTHMLVHTVGNLASVILYAGA